MKRSGAQIITTLLERQGVGTVTGIPGGSTLPLYDALRESSMRHVLARHEQGAGFMAQGMARATGRAAVCLATSGPGATNLLTAVADARLDSVPIVAITGQVPTGLIGTDAFQEVDTYGLTVPITKHNFLVRTAGDLLEVIPEAFSIAESGRPGPVVIDVPKDVQSAEVSFDRWPDRGVTAAAPPLPRGEVKAMARAIAASRRPVLYAGGGVIASGASAELCALARKGAIPVATTLAGIGSFPGDDPLSLGMLGMHGERRTNMVLEEADLLIALGVRFDDRATGKAAEFCSRANIIHVDIDPSEIGKIKRPNLALRGDAREVLERLLPGIPFDERPEWRRVREGLKGRFPPALFESEGFRHPRSLMCALSTSAPGDRIVTTDVGQHQMWVAQHYTFRNPRTLLTSGGLGTMGFGLPAALGAAMAKPGTPVLCISGDGSILMNIQELATLAELDLDVKVLVLNNGHLGLVRQQQHLFYGDRIFASRFGSVPDFAAVARGFGIQGHDLAGEEGDVGRLEEIFSAAGPALVNIPVSPDELVLPMVPPGAANSEMVEKEACHV